MGICVKRNSVFKNRLKEVNIVTDIFSNIILKAITDYKLFLRRILSAKDCSAKIVQLGIKRTQLREIGNDDVAFYKIAALIAKDLESYILQEKKDDMYYSGAEEFLRYLNRILGEYLVEGNKVVHTTQSAACAVVDAFQILSLSEQRFTTELIEKFVKSLKTVAKYGDISQINLFVEAIHSQEKRIVEAFRRNGRIFRLEDYFVVNTVDE